MASPSEIWTFHVDIPMTQELHDALVDQMKARGLSPGKTIAVLLAEVLGKPSGPAWTTTEIAALRDGPKKILKVLAHTPGGLAPNELAADAGTKNSTKAYLAHLTMRYKHGKEPLHQWDEATNKYLINPKYREDVLAALS